MIETSLLLDLAIYSAQVTCVVAVGAALAALIRVDAAGVRYAYWRALLALCLVLPWLQARQSVVAPMTAPSAMVAAPLQRVSVAAGAASTPSPAMDWVALAVWILAAGVVFRGCRIAVGLWRLRQLRLAGRLAPACDAHRELQELVRVSAEIRYVSGGQPVTFGFRHPIVLLPEMLRSQSDEVQRVVLCHELFHVRRRDWLWVVAEELVKAALWFHPAVLWLIARVRQAREEVVDELTVLATAQRRAYLEALLVFADAPTQAPAAAFAQRRHLFRRMVLISKEAVMSSRRILLSVAAMTAVTMIGVWSAVSVFPLTQTVLAQGRGGGRGAIAPGGGPGPIERQAKAITPENPIPRRTFSVTPQNPSDGTTGVVFVSVRVVIDRQGRVPEARSAGVGLVAGRGPVSQPGPPPSEAFTKAVVDAVRQWQYDPPADGPIAFDVSFSFTQGSEPRMVSHGGPAGIRFSAAPGGVVGGVVGGLPDGPPPPPPPPPPGWAVGAVRVGGNIRPPAKLRHVDPVYPAIAQSARVQGVVILEAIIGADGRVADARVLRSVPLLDQAALDSVRQWEFAPTNLNGAPVPVIMTVTVQFSLQ